MTDLDDAVEYRDMRQRAGLTQEQWAVRIGVTRKSVGRWESGATIPAEERVSLMRLVSSVVPKMMRERDVRRHRVARKPWAHGEVVYLFSELDTFTERSRYGRYVKIGVSVDPIRRLGGMSSGNPRPLFMNGWLRLDGVPARCLERALHHTLWDKRVGGEWFRLDERDVGCVLGLTLSPKADRGDPVCVDRGKARADVGALARRMSELQP